MRLEVQAFYLPKSGNRPGEYEDAWAYDERAKRLAIADGASDAFEAGLWARSLVEKFIREPPVPRRVALQRWLESPIEVWKQGICWEKLTWYEGKKARRGSFATFLGVTLVPVATKPGERARGAVRWRAIAVGDACLFQVRRNELIVSFPLKRASDFGTTPPLISTRTDYNLRSLQELRSHRGSCQPGDLLILATDAAAAWLLWRVEAGEQPWKTLVGLAPPEFSQLVEEARSAEIMRNDDVTLIMARLDPSDQPAKQRESRAARLINGATRLLRGCVE